jgi:CCT motif
MRTSKDEHLGTN